MRTIAHISDLHFGRVDPATLEPLHRHLHAARPDLLVVSGDLTQRARERQFRVARSYLDTLPQPQLVVPGNHDVPLYDVLRRFLAPLARYKRIISADLEPTFVDDEIAVVGVNTARSLTFKGGRINRKQVAAVKARLCELPERVVKILVTHHPFDVPEHQDEDGHLVGRARMALESLAGCGADLLLAGHLHEPRVGHTAERYSIPGVSALIVQAGTATSTRTRETTNSFNLLRVEAQRVEVESFAWDGSDFHSAGTQSFRHGDGGWT
jgi:3',5'-cyclic AMP phosphodiesterase CpdA